MEAAHSQLTVYRSTASVPGQCTTEVFNRAKSHSAVISKRWCIIHLTGCWEERRLRKRTIFNDDDKWAEERVI